MSAVAAALTLDFAKAGYLDPRITFGRASSGAYYDGKTSAVAEQNLYQYSQGFTQAVAWACTDASVVANSTIAPDGTLTGSTLVSTGTSSPRMYTAVNTTVIAGDYIASVHLKQGSERYALMYNSNGVYAVFDLSGGTVTQSSVAVATITSVGNGWYRCSIKITYSAATVGTMRLAFTDNQATPGSTTPTITTASGLYFHIWGAQLEQRSAASAYTPTGPSPITNYIPQLMTAAANQPRFDYDPVTGESKGLMVEESRANLLTYSADITGWTKANATIDANVLVAPDGTLSAEGVGESSAASSIATGTVTITANGTYTFSVYVKKSIGDWHRLVMYDNGGSSNRVSAWFNIATGVVGTVSNGGTGSGASGTITPVGNGWYRLTLSGAINNSSTSVVCLIASALADANTTSFSGAYKFVWGAQLEAGAGATSYIATTSSQVTRSADLPNIPASLFASILAGGMGTIFIESNTPTIGDYNLVTLSDGTINNALYLKPLNSAVAAAAIGVYSNIPVSLTVSAYPYGSFVKTAFAFSAGRYAMSINGAAAVTSSYGLVPVVNQMKIGSSGAGSAQNFTGWIKRIAIFAKPVANDELVELTA